MTRKALMKAPYFFDIIQKQVLWLQISVCDVQGMTPLNCKCNLEKGKKNRKEFDTEYKTKKFHINPTQRRHYIQ